MRSVPGGELFGGRPRLGTPTSQARGGAKGPPWTVRTAFLRRAPKKERPISRPFETMAGFFNINFEGKPQFTSGNVQVYNARIPVVTWVCVNKNPPGIGPRVFFFASIY